MRTFPDKVYYISSYIESSMIKESETLEFKKSTAQLKEAVISIAAMLNKHRKGELYFGISNDGKIIGQDTSEKTIRNISNAISEHIEPKIYPAITEQDKCIKVGFSGNETPYLCILQGYNIRVGDEDRKLSAKEIERIILEKRSKTFCLGPKQSARKRNIMTSA